MRKKFWITLLGLLVLAIANFFLFSAPMPLFVHILQVIVLLTNLFFIMKTLTSSEGVLQQDKVPSILVAIVSMNFIDRLARKIALTYFPVDELKIKYIVLGSLLLFLLLSWFVLTKLLKGNKKLPD